MLLKKHKLESRLSLYKRANKNCATLAKIKHNRVTMTYRNIYKKRAQSFQGRYHPVLRLRSDCSICLRWKVPHLQNYPDGQPLQITYSTQQSFLKR